MGNSRWNWRNVTVRPALVGLAVIGGANLPISPERTSDGTVTLALLFVGMGVGILVLARRTPHT